MLLGQSRSLYPSGVPIRPSLCFSSRVTAFVQKTSALPKMASVDASTKANAKLQNCKILSHEPLVRYDSPFHFMVPRSQEAESRRGQVDQASQVSQKPLFKIFDPSVTPREPRRSRSLQNQLPRSHRATEELGGRGAHRMPFPPSTKRPAHSRRPPQTRTDAPIDGVGVIALLQPPPSAKSPAASPPEGPLIVLQKQFRPPVGKVCIEIPAGLLDPKESAATCAVRELKEETGYEGAAVEGGVRGWHGMSAAVGESKGDGSISEVLFNGTLFLKNPLLSPHHRRASRTDIEATASQTLDLLIRTSLSYTRPLIRSDPRTGQARRTRSSRKTNSSTPSRCHSASCGRSAAGWRRTRGVRSTRGSERWRRAWSWPRPSSFLRQEFRAVTGQWLQQTPRARACNCVVPSHWHRPRPPLARKEDKATRRPGQV